MKKIFIIPICKVIKWTEMLHGKIWTMYLNMETVILNFPHAWILLFPILKTLCSKMLKFGVWQFSKENNFREAAFSVCGGKNKKEFCDTLKMNILLLCHF